MMGDMRMEDEMDFMEDGTDFFGTTPAYDWEQAKAVAKLTTELMEILIQKWEDHVEALEGDLGMKDLRKLQGVGIVLEGMLGAFRTNYWAYGTLCDEGAATAAYYYLEDF